MTESQAVHPSPNLVPKPHQEAQIEHFDVLVVGAGLSGICAAYHLQTKCADKRYAILEARDGIGGTWDLFRYPGIRSDSDMHTMSYTFQPWSGEKAIADGADILRYIRNTAEKYDIDRKIRFGQRVVRASWNSDDALWTVEVEAGPEKSPERYRANFVLMCSGYYDYDRGYLPDWPDLGRFAGTVVHPQKWPEDLDYTDKRVLVIGSGATAVTLIPAMAEKAAHITMLQRSPTYVVARPEKDVMANRLNRLLPEKLAGSIVRWKNVLYGMYIYRQCKRRPEVIKQLLINLVRQELGPDYDVETHFTPRYYPWDQRLCLVPDSDLFNVIRGGKASVVTDEIEGFTETGVRLRSGRHLDADIIVTATGLKLIPLGGMQVNVDGRRIDLGKALTYKGMMFSDIPNLASVFGYTNASWTLKAELTIKYVCRLLNYMDEHGYAWCAPRKNDPSILEETALNLTSGYIQRAKDIMPKQGSKPPWKLYQNYFKDISLLQFGSVDDDAMEFGRVGAVSRAA